jgi:hypothetical protein
MSEPKVRFSLNMSVTVGLYLAQLMEWLNTDNATQVICHAITVLYIREAAKQELPAEGRKDEPAN